MGCSLVDTANAVDETPEREWEIVSQFIRAEAHPYYTQRELRGTPDRYGIPLMRWYPLGHCGKSPIQGPVFAEPGAGTGCLCQAACFRWGYAHSFPGGIPGAAAVAKSRALL